MLNRYENLSFASLGGADARKALLMVGIMTAHAFGEGCGVGVSFAGNRGWVQGCLVTLAIGVHNIPEGLATATVLVGYRKAAAAPLLFSFEPLFFVDVYFNFASCLLLLTPCPLPSAPCPLSLASCLLPLPLASDPVVLPVSRRRLRKGRGR